MSGGYLQSSYTPSHRGQRQLLIYGKKLDFKHYHIFRLWYFCRFCETVGNVYRKSYIFTFRYVMD